MSMQTRSVLLERKTLQSSIQIGDPEKKAPVRESVEKDSVKKKVVWLDFCGNNDSKEIIGQTTTLQMLQWTGSGSFHLKISLYQLDLYLQVTSSERHFLSKLIIICRAQAPPHCIITRLLRLHHLRSPLLH